ncbi:hypothetical protein C5U62_32210 [Pseudomonas protegens]|uniref:Uncharacterized protein n=1 Tax=Pseudomonas protegens TaxID=380021 RepID=A0A2T6GB58_9PSED|nr:hypothetical protein [Pseudomonas protegens]PUA41389.1 hypothetical protein C5U62_32210 [Pseudomonas protegens]
MTRVPLNLDTFHASRLMIETVQQAFAYPERLARIDAAAMLGSVLLTLRSLHALNNQLVDEVRHLESLLDAPERHNFARGAVLEAAHQRQRRSSSHDSGKTRHHTISTAAALNNWHAHLTDTNTGMHPGLGSDEGRLANESEPRTETNEQESSHGH